MFKIYTKTGDKGGTSLIGGVRVPKSHIRIESYGTVDELNSYIGMVNDMAGNEQINSWLREIQDRLFTVGSILATAPDKDVKMKLPDLHEADVTWLEQRIDEMNEVLPEMRAFILPRWSIGFIYLPRGKVCVPQGRAYLCSNAGKPGSHTSVGDPIP